MKKRISRTFHRCFRAFKNFFIQKGDCFSSRAFFMGVRLLDRILSRRRRLAFSRKTLYDVIWKYNYFTRFGAEALFQVVTNKPVAIDSDDHLWPRGTIRDNSSNLSFNRKTYYYFKFKPNLKVLDMGCSGGGVVRSFLEDGHTAIGIEGSDHSKKLRSGEWDTCPNHLFTGDISSPFQVLDAQSKPVLFDVIVSWEVLEHIEEQDLPTLFENVAKHLAPQGVFVCSVATFPDADPSIGAVYHVTLQPRDWWLEKMARAGLVPVDSHPYEVEDYVRGNGSSFKEWDPRDGYGFHLVMRKK